MDDLVYDFIEYLYNCNDYFQIACDGQYTYNKELGIIKIKLKHYENNAESFINSVEKLISDNIDLCGNGNMSGDLDILPFTDNANELILYIK